MSKQSTSFEVGFALGSVVREFRRALSRPPVVVQAQAPVASSVQRIEPAMLAGPTAKELEHISDVPAIVRLKKSTSMTGIWPTRAKCKSPSARANPNRPRRHPRPKHRSGRSSSWALLIN